MHRCALFALRLIGVVLFVFILTHLDLQKLQVTLAQASWPLLGCALCLFPIIYALKAWRWHVLIRTCGVHQAYGRSFRTYCAALFLGLLTPGNVGEAIKIAYLRAAGASLKAATLITIVDRLYDILWIGLFALPSMFFLLPSRFAVLVAVVGALAVGLVLMRKLLPLGTATMQSYAFQWKPHLLTLANWAVYYFQLLIIGAAFHLSVPIPAFLGIMTVAGVVNLFAIAPAGLGTREATLLFFFAPYHIDPVLTVAFSFSIFLLTITASLLGGYFWLRTPLSPS